jgi:cysteinyl-tRNA synthetase
LKALEAQLPGGIGVIGVDEHTAVVFDLISGEISVHGPGGLTLRMQGESEFVTAGSTTTLDHLRQFFGSAKTSVLTEAEPADTLADSPSDRFAALLAAGDTEGAAAISLEVEAELFSSSSPEAHTALRSMLVQLADTARNGLVDTRAVLEPLVDIALEVRRLARENKDYAMSDLVRDALTAADIEVRDTPDGMVWEQLAKQ